MRTGALRTAAEKAMGMTRAVAGEIVARITTAAIFAWLPVAEMKVHPPAQRLLRRAWIRRHVAAFDANQLGVICVSRRADGSLWLIDGQHRVELIRAVGWGDQALYCEIFEGLTVQQEAAMFLVRNDRISVRAFDKFTAGVTAGEDSCPAINKLVSDLGLCIAEGNRDGSISAVRALQSIYSGAGVASGRDGTVALRSTLETIVAAWGKSSTNFKAEVIGGLGLIYLRYGQKIDRDALVLRLGKIAGGAAKLIQQGRSAREFHGGSIAYAVGAVIVQGYNRGRSTRKLDGWWS